MKLTLIRHANAAVAMPDQSDSDRLLDRKGKAELVSAMKIWKKLNLHWDVIMASPTARALQTAKWIRKRGFSRHAVVILPELTVGRSYTDLIAVLPTSGSIAWVGHNPQLSELAAHILNVSHESVSLSTSGLITIVKNHSEAPFKLEQLI